MSASDQKESEVTKGMQDLKVSGNTASSHSGKPNGEGKNGPSERGDRAEKPIMVARNKTGIVKWFSFKNGYGFITVDGDGDDIFVHRSEFIREGAREVFYHLDVGDQLEFDIINRAKGREAVAVTGPNGVRIPGSPANYGRGGRRGGGGGRRRDTEEHYEDAQAEPDEHAANGEGKKRGGGRGGRRRNTSNEGGQDNGNDSGEPQKDKGERRRRPRRNTGGRGGARAENGQENS